MKAVLLAGGLGSRLSEETHLKPKPMVEIGGRPIIWHIMKHYSTYGINDFIICCGYKGYIIKEFFSNYNLHLSDVTLDLKNNKKIVHKNNTEPWRVTLVETGEHTQTGGRLKRIREHIGKDELFCATYGDGVSDVNIRNLITFHNNEKRLATLTAVRPPGRFGQLSLDESKITSFQEKPKNDGGWINGGFFVLSTKVFNYIDGDETIWEQEPLTNLVRDEQVAAYRHHGFWACMDTLRDKHSLETQWELGNAPWKVWEG